MEIAVAACEAKFHLEKARISTKKKKREHLSLDQREDEKERIHAK